MCRYFNGAKSLANQVNIQSGTEWLPNIFWVERVMIRWIRFLSNSFSVHPVFYIHFHENMLFHCTHKKNKNWNRQRKTPVPNWIFVNIDDQKISMGLQIEDKKMAYVVNSITFRADRPMIVSAALWHSLKGTNIIQILYSLKYFIILILHYKILFQQVFFACSTMLINCCEMLQFRNVLLRKFGMNIEHVSHAHAQRWNDAVS